MDAAVASEQDKAFQLNYQNYQQATQLVQAGKYDQAQKMFSGLDQDSQSSWQVNYYRAICAQETEDWPAAVNFMQQVRAIRPALLMDQGYLERFGVILYGAGDYERARLYLQQSLNYPQDAGMVQEANNYLAKIDARAKNAR
jgi:tetratricopeptide (TPR) repeat protein